MGGENIRIVDKVSGVSKFSDVCESYLSPLKTLCGGREYQLIETWAHHLTFLDVSDKPKQGSICLSFLATVLKVITYLTLILPIIAEISLLISRRRHLGKKADYPSIFNKDSAPFQITQAATTIAASNTGLEEFTAGHQSAREPITIGDFTIT